MKNVSLKRLTQEIGSAPASASHPPALGFTANRRRSITPHAGRAIEKLGHAIEYLADDIVSNGSSLSGSDPQVQAIGILMALNREIYYECPLKLTLGQRIRSIYCKWAGRDASGRVNKNPKESA